MHICNVLLYAASCILFSEVSVAINDFREIPQAKRTRYGEVKAEVQYTEANDDVHFISIPPAALNRGHYELPPIETGYDLSYFVINWCFRIYSSAPDFVLFKHQHTFPDFPNSRSRDVGGHAINRKAYSNVVEFSYASKVNVDALLYRRTLRVVHRITVDGINGSASEYDLNVSNSFTLHDSVIDCISFRFDDESYALIDPPSKCVSLHFLEIRNINMKLRKSRNPRPMIIPIKVRIKSIGSWDTEKDDYAERVAFEHQTVTVRFEITKEMKIETFLKTRFEGVYKYLFTSGHFSRNKMLKQPLGCRIVLSHN